MAVLIVKEDKDPRKSIRQILQTFEKVIDISQGIFLKPNIVFPVREKTGEITRLKLVRSLIQVLREIYPGVDIVIGEGTAAGTIPAENFAVTGYSKLAKELKVDLIDLNRVEHIKLKWEYGVIQVPKMIFEKAYINLPILKKSSAAIISGAMKNQKGLLQTNMKKNFHKFGLHDPIAYLNKLIQPNLTIMDGFNFFNQNLIFAGNNTYEIDRLAVSILHTPEPDYLKKAREIDVGDDNFTIQGMPIEKILSNRKYKFKKYKKFLRMRLWANPRACSMCRFSFIQIKNFPTKDIKYTLLMCLKLIKYGAVGAEIIFGTEPQFKCKYKNIICIGNCTKRIAQENNYKFIPGCPPTRKQILETF